MADELPMISVQRRGDVIVATIANPPLNFMNREMVAELERVVDVADSDPGVGAVVLTGGVEGSFLTHYEIQEIVTGVQDVPGPTPGPRAAGALLRSADAISRLPGGDAAIRRTPARGLRELRQIHDLFLRMNRSGVVFIAAINGTATGGGCELALACDIRIGADDPTVRIGLPEMTVGINPGAGGTQRLSRAVGSARALEMMLEGEALGAAEAAEAGLLNKVVTAEELMPVAIATAQRLARRSRAAVKALKHAVYEGVPAGLEEGMAIERRWFMSVSGLDPAIRAMTAFADQIAAEGASPWADPERIKPWQEGIVVDMNEREGNGG